MTPYPHSPDRYVVICYDGSGGTRIAEREMHRTGWDDTIADIADGEITDVHQVWQANPDGPIFRDVTEDVAGAVYGVLHEGGRGCKGSLRDFLENHLSIRDVEYLLAQAGMADEIYRGAA